MRRADPRSPLRHRNRYHYRHHSRYHYRHSERRLRHDVDARHLASRPSGAAPRATARLAQRTTTATQRALRSAARVRIADSALPPGHALAATLPDASTRQPRVAALLALAAEAGVAVRSAEFKVVREPGAAQLQYTVTLPVSGPYAAVRGFIEAALRADAALSLDRLQLRRTSVAATVTDAELVWSLHMRIGPAAPPAGSAQP